MHVTPAAPAPLTHRAATVAPAEPADRDGYAGIRRQRLDHLRGRGSRLRHPLTAAAKYAAIALMGLLLAVLAALLTPLPELFGWQIFAVQTGSMEPAIPVGSLIAVQPVRAADLAEGDVITFSERTRPDVRVTHRIVSLETKDGQRVAVTKGDANNTTDSWNVPLNEAIGRVAFHLPFMGYVLAWLGSTVVKLAALALAGVMLTMPVLRRWFGGREGVKRDRRQEAIAPAAPRSSPAIAAAAGPGTAGERASALKETSVVDDADEDSDVPFDALANEIDVLLGRIATGDGAPPVGARALATRQKEK